jgi:putative peptide zinc metalloprotease protein
MKNVLDSVQWYRVANLKPALQSHIRVSQQNLRDKTWFVLHDSKSARHHRFTPTANLLIGRLDGKRTLQQIWDEIESLHPDLDIGQEEVIKILIQLNTAELLLVPQSAGVPEMLKRGQQRQKGKRKSRFINPLALRFPVFDPDTLLSNTLPRLQWLFSRASFAIWLVTILAALLLAAMHWSELTENISDRVLAPKNMLLIWLIYPCIKTLHELGHGYMARYYGAEVHEMGIMVLVFMPVPYVDASASATFTDPRHRMLVGAAGILVEMFVAALAMFVWVLAEPGLVHAVAFNVMLIGAISTVLVNGNPLLKFDGYYVLSDFLQVPNLASRSNRFIGYLMRRYLLGISAAESPADSSDEARILGCYSIAAFSYRMFIMYAIVLFVAGKYFVVGSILAIYAITMQLVIPLYRNFSKLLNSSEFRDLYAAGMKRLASMVVAIMLILFAIPVPLTTSAEGVVWLPPESEVRARADAFVTRVVAVPGTRVVAGDLLLLLEDPEAVAKEKILSAELTEAAARYTAVRSVDPVQAEILKENISRISRDLELVRTRLASLSVRSEREGEFAINDPDNMIGRFVRNGELLGFVSENSNNTVIVTVSQDEIGLIRSRRGAIELRLAERLNQVIDASVVRETPAASRQLPSAALGSKGGGRFATNPVDTNGLETIEEVFQLELAADEPTQRFGERAYVRFEHGYQPLALQWYRNIRQVFLSQLDV